MRKEIRSNVGIGIFYCRFLASKISSFLIIKNPKIFRNKNIFIQFIKLEHSSAELNYY
jgi:hypothetical protein